MVLFTTYYKYSVGTGRKHEKYVISPWSISKKGSEKAFLCWVLLRFERVAKKLRVRSRISDTFCMTRVHYIAIVGVIR